MTRFPYTLRTMDPDFPEDDIRAMARLDAECGVPGVRPWLERVVRDGWLRRNPRIFRLLESGGRLRGFVGLVPLREEGHRDFLSGARFPYGGATAADVLTTAQEAAARAAGLHVWVESFSHADADAARALAEFLFGTLSAANLRSILATSSTPRDEEHCRWWGLTERYAWGPSATGTRRLWCADEESLCCAGSALGMPVPVRAAFMESRRRFGAPATLGLTPAERRVARLFYAAELTEGQVARELGLKASTVRTHLKRVRAKALPAVGSPVSRAVAAWLADHPSELSDGNP